MSHLPPQTWQRGPFRLPIAPHFSGVLRNIRPIIRRISALLSIRLKSLAKPLVFLKGFHFNVKPVINGSVIILLYSLVMKADAITDVLEYLDNLNTQRVLASVVTDQSGYARSVDQSLLPLERTVQTVGDDDQDQQVKLFLTFYFGPIPDNAKVVDAQLNFQCALEGDISGFGDLSLHEVEFNGYSGGVFNSFPATANTQSRISFDHNDRLLSGCSSNKDLAFSSKGLAQMVATHRKEGKINLVLYFEGKSILANRQSDGIKIVTTPQLHVSFKP